MERLNLNSRGKNVLWLKVKCHCKSHRESQGILLCPYTTFSHQGPSSFFVAQGLLRSPPTYWELTLGKYQVPSGGISAQQVAPTLPEGILGCSILWAVSEIDQASPLWARNSLILWDVLKFHAPHAPHRPTTLLRIVPRDTIPLSFIDRPFLFFTFDTEFH